jgi:hypothetical protein
VHQRAEEGRRQRIEIDLRLAHDIARDELRRVLEHVDEAVQFAQDVVGDVARGARLAVQEDRDVGVAARISATKSPQILRVQPGFRASGRQNSSSSIDRMKVEPRLCCCANEVRSP